MSLPPQRKKNLFSKGLYPKLSCHIFINGLDDGAGCIPSASLITENREEQADAPESCAAIQRELSHLEKWADRNFISFHKGMCKILHLWKNKKASLQQDMLEAN